MAAMIYFTIEELCRSTVAAQKGINNTPPKYIREKLEIFVRDILDPLRILFGKPIKITSGYRSLELNSAIKGSLKSQHMNGEAVDMVCENNEYLFSLIQNNFEYDQLIFETKDKFNKNGDKTGVTSWIHLSYKHNGANRKSCFKMHNHKLTK